MTGGRDGFELVVRTQAGGIGIEVVTVGGVYGSSDDAKRQLEGGLYLSAEACKDRHIQLAIEDRPREVR
jgi:hypothetical protein